LVACDASVEDGGCSSVALEGVRGLFYSGKLLLQDFTLGWREVRGHRDLALQQLGIAQDGCQVAAARMVNGSLVLHARNTCTLRSSLKAIGCLAYCRMPGSGEDARWNRYRELVASSFGRDPDALCHWYAETLGVPRPPATYDDPDWQQVAGPTVWGS
jgi:hypothetical protein